MNPIKYLLSFLILLLSQPVAQAHGLSQADVDSVTYANAEMKKYVQKFINPTKITRRGTVKKNRRYSPEFTTLIAALEASEMVFNFTDDEQLIPGKNTVGLVSPTEDGTINIIVPSYGQDTEKGRLQSIMGGRSNLLAEETFHAVQILKGEIIPEKDGFIRGSSSIIAAEVNAKIFAAHSGMSRLRSSNFKPGYSVPTIAKLIRDTNVDKLSVLHIIARGGTGIASRIDVTGTVVVTYPPSYHTDQ